MSESSTPSQEPPRYLRVVNVDPPEESDVPANAVPDISTNDAGRSRSTWLDYRSSDETNWTELRDLRFVRVFLIGSFEMRVNEIKQKSETFI